MSEPAPTAASAPVPAPAAAAAAAAAAAVHADPSATTEGAAAAAPAPHAGTVVGGAAANDAAAAAPAPAATPAPSSAGAGAGAPKERARTAGQAARGGRGGGAKRQKTERQYGRDKGWDTKGSAEGSGATLAGGDGSDDEGAGGTGGGRLGKKRKVALAIMYRGTGYFGLQLQNGAHQADQPTVERVLLDAIHAAGGVSKENMEATSKIKWMRAARTDKGVHAAGNLLSLNLVCDGPPPAGCLSSSPDVLERINAHLPRDVRAIAYTRTLASFHAKYACTSRVYEYILPSFVFDDSEETLALLRYEGNDPLDAPASAYVYHPRLLSYRLTPEKRARLVEIMSCFKGTHNFQNFTRKKSSFLREAHRDAMAAHAAQGHKAAKDDAAGSEDEGEGLDDAAEEALERAEFAASTARAASVAAASTPVLPSPFALAGRHGPPRVRQPLLTHLKSSNGPQGKNTNKTSGQFARFIRYIIDFNIQDVYLHTMGQQEAGVDAGSNGAEAMGDVSAAPAAAATGAPSVPSGSSPVVAPPSPPASTLEFVRLRIHGQSFMLNQIRKMVGALLLIARGHVPLSYLTDKALALDEYAVPTAPSLGLLLDRPVYADYDAKVAGMADRATIASLFQRPAVDAFRSECIYQQICEAEVRTGSAAQWVARLWNSTACVQHKMDEREEEDKRKHAQAEAEAEKQASGKEAGAAGPVSEPGLLTPAAVPAMVPSAVADGAPVVAMDVEPATETNDAAAAHV